MVHRFNRFLCRRYWNLYHIQKTRFQIFVKNWVNSLRNMKCKKCSTHKFLPYSVNTKVDFLVELYTSRNTSNSTNIGLLFFIHMRVTAICYFYKIICMAIGTNSSRKFFIVNSPAISTYSQAFNINHNTNNYSLNIWMMFFKLQVKDRE